MSGNGNGKLTDDQLILKALQDGMPIHSRPFDVIAKKLKMTEGDVVKNIERLKKKGVIREVGVILQDGQPKKIQCMITWSVPEKIIEQVGTTMIRSPHVLNCGQRRKLKEFPYNLYTVVEGKTREDVISIARQLSADAGVNHHKMLWTKTEYKNEQPDFFSASKS